MRRFDGRVIIVTGGARGQGAVHVRRLIERGPRSSSATSLTSKGETSPPSWDCAPSSCITT